MTTDTPSCHIIKISPTPFPHLAQAVDDLLATHPESNELMLTCREIGRAVCQIEASCPGYADELLVSVQRRLRLVRRGAGLQNGVVAAP